MREKSEHAKPVVGGDKDHVLAYQSAGVEDVPVTEPLSVITVTIGTEKRA